MMLTKYFDIIFSYYNLQESYTSKEIIVKMTRKALLAALSLELVLMLFATSTNSPKYSQKREEKVLKLHTRFQTNLLELRLHRV